MGDPCKESQIILAIQSLQKDPHLSRRAAGKIFNVPESTLRDRMRGKCAKAEQRSKSSRLTELEEEAITKYILNLDSRGFSPRLHDVEDMANVITEARDASRVGTRWASNFVKRQPQLKTRLSRAYDYQRALCEDPEKIAGWFGLFQNIKAKYGIQDEDIYNFDETGFMMGQITSSMVITGADRSGRRKKVQPGNREWVTVIQGVCTDGWCVPPFIVVKGVYHLANWYSDSTLPRDWVIKPTENGWTNNETGLDWIRHFEKHTATRTRGRHRMLVIDGHESHVSAAFEAYCKEKNIITVSMPPHSSHLLQPLDVGCFGPLKRAYGREIEGFMKLLVNHITKAEFLIAFQAAFSRVFTPENVQAGFRGAGLVPLNPDRVMSTLDVKLSTPSPTGSLPTANILWASQTPHNLTEATSQTDYIRNRIRRHQGSSPTPILSAINQLSKGARAIIHENTLLKAENRALREANSGLAKRRRAKKTRIKLRGTLTVGDAQDLLDQKDINTQLGEETRASSSRTRRAQPRERHCRACGKTGHNARTCKMDRETSEYLDSE